MQTLPLIEARSGVPAEEGALPACRHRGPRQRSGACRCRSPKLVGLGIVGAEDCRACAFCDHEAEAEEAVHSANHGRHFLPCAYWGTALADAVHDCHHPSHRRTTWDNCQSCADYLFPFLSPGMPERLVEPLLELGPKDQPGEWWHFSNVQRAYRRLARRQARALIAANSAIGPRSLGDGGRGIVIAGGGKYFPCAYVTVRVLRHVGCDLPVELWHFDGEMDDFHADLLRPFGVTCVNAAEMARAKPFRFLHGHWWKGWQLKPYAIAHSRFDEVLFLDADCYPTRDPSFLFDLADYREHGAIFWPDLIESWALGGWQVKKVFGVQPSKAPLESGQMLINKNSCAAELQMALWYNARADYVYQHLWGDKDTFAVAWALCRRDFVLPWPKAAWERHTILQYDPEGRVLFQHRCRDKFRLEKCRFDSSPQNFGHNHFHAALAHEEFCFQALAELKERLDQET